MRRRHLPGAALLLAANVGLSLLGLSTVSPEQARALTELGVMWNGRLPNVKNLSPETAAVLAGFKGPRLDLDGATLSKEALEEVAALPSDPAKPDSPTFGALLKAGKLPIAK
jgi:hypothetical protein